MSLLVSGIDIFDFKPSLVIIGGAACVIVCTKLPSFRFVSVRHNLSVRIAMASDPQYPDSMFKGWRYYFNSYTLKGRSTIVYTTYAGVFLIFLGVRRRIKKNAALRAAAEKS
uniref:Up-regulated during skeletal muscle growth protein 5 n=1 Tax=Schistocephalus solidus TaxID=70667 RepID=A0A0X3PHE4_SCHSO